MNAYRPAPANNFWITALKIGLLVLGLYVAGRVFSWLFVILFYLIKIIVYAVVAFTVLHFLLKVLFGVNLFNNIIGSRFGRR